MHTYKNRHVYWGIENRLPREAVLITKELGDVTFIGATAVFFHIKSDRSRRTHDIDIAVATEIAAEELQEKGYKITENGKNKKIWKPGGLQIDIFTDCVGGIPVRDMIHRAKTVPVGKSGG